MRYRRNQFWKIRSSLAVMVVAAMLSACGKSDGSAADSSEGVEPSGTAMASPLAELLGWNESVATVRDNSIAVEQRIVTCMREQGWEYQPVPFPASDELVALMDERIADPVAFGSTNGYGIVRQYELQYAAGDFDAGRPRDPNTDYVVALSPDDRIDYFEALSGAQSATVVGDTAASSAEPKMPPMENSGCRAEAERAVKGERPGDDPAINSRVATMTMAIDDDPLVLAATARWIECMTALDPAYRWTSPNELQSALYQELDAAERAVAPVPLFGYPDESTPATVSPRPMIDAGVLGDLRAKEMRLWAADSGCAAQAELAEARREVEQRIVDDLIAEFPELAQS